MLLSHQLAPPLAFLQPEGAYFNLIQINIRNDFPGHFLTYFGSFSAPNLSLRVGEFNPTLALQTSQQVATGPPIPDTVRPAPIPCPTDLQRNLLTVPIRMAGENLSDLIDILEGNVPRGTAQNDCALTSIRNTGGQRNHAPHDIRFRRKNPEGSLSSWAFGY
jgi:hypothetical protein